MSACPPGPQMATQLRCEAFGRIVRAPGAVAVAARRAAKKRRIEQDEVKALTLHRREQIPLPHLDLVFQLIQGDIDLRTAHRRRIDVHRDHATRTAGRKDSAHAGSRAQVENVTVAGGSLGGQY